MEQGINLVELEQMIEQARLDRCTILDLSLCPLDEISFPESIGNLSNLTTLNLGSWDLCRASHNQLTNLPDSIGSFSNLTSLNLLNNLLTSLPDSIGSLSNLTSLNLLNNLLASQPDSIGNLSSLTELNLSNNQLASLPDSIGNLSSLTKLNLSNSSSDGWTGMYRCNNHLQTIPESIGNLSKLTELNLCGNQLSSLPESLSNLSSLVRLNLASNQLSTFPDSIENISRITINLLNGENLAVRSQSVSTLSSLTYLDLSGNQFTTIPESLCNLPKLNHLILTDNPLTDLSSLQRLPNVADVYFLGIRLPRRYWIKLSDWSYEWLLDEDNVEVRRVLIEQLGYQNITEELNSLTLDNWREYTLLKVDKINQVYNKNTGNIEIEPMVLLKMTCPSTQHIHILRVPPEMTSAEAAITWVNHGIHPDEFAVQT